MPSARRQAIGAFGESAALGYLQRQGYRLLERNWRGPDGEVDLIAQQGDQVVFVEVRTRSNHRHGLPEASLSRQKRQRLIALAYHYLAANGYEQASWRIDVIAIDVDQGRISRLEHIRSAIEEQA